MFRSIRNSQTLRQSLLLFFLDGFPWYVSESESIGTTPQMQPNDRSPWVINLPT